jgi:CRP/FNR family transcriptional regulator, dissimilatory nitrate respiration regulator
MKESNHPLAALGLGKGDGPVRTNRRHLARGEALFRQGDPARALFVIEEGRLTLTRHAPDGRRLVLFTARKGDSLAEAALFAEAYHCDATAESRAVVIEVPKAGLRRLMRAEPRVAAALTARLARQVQDLRQRLELRNIRNARDRVWHKLLLDTATNSVLTLDRPLKEVAAEIGLTHEAFYRALASLAKEGRIRRRGRIIRLMPGA